MRALVFAALLLGGCTKSEPPKENAPPPAHADGGKPMVRVAKSAAAASAVAAPDAGR